MAQPTAIAHILAYADARFAAEGGYKATAWCEACRVDLIRQDAAGKESIVSTAPMAVGTAPEDVAYRLLVAEIGLAKADNEYLVVTVR